jgi:hypothetical protein
MTDYHAVPADGKWTVRKAGSSRAAKVFDDELVAWHECRRLARGSYGRAYLYGRNGRIRARNDYGGPDG